jgi:hypothetical protein
LLFSGLQEGAFIHYCKITRMYYNYLQKAGTTACQASAHQIGIPELPYPVGSPTLWKKYKAAGAPTAQTLKHNTSVKIIREGLKKDIELYKAGAWGKDKSIQMLRTKNLILEKNLRVQKMTGKIVT